MSGPSASTSSSCASVSTSTSTISGGAFCSAAIAVGQLLGTANRLGRRQVSFALLGRRQRQVVVLDQDRVEQTGAMIVTAAHADRVFFQPPPAGRRLASVVDSRAAFRRPRRRSAA